MTGKISATRRDLKRLQKRKKTHAGELYLLIVRALSAARTSLMVEDVQFPSMVLVQCLFHVLLEQLDIMTLSTNNVNVGTQKYGVVYIIFGTCTTCKKELWRFGHKPFLQENSTIFFLVLF